MLPFCLVELPPEVLKLSLLDARFDREELRALRLVCRLFNNLVEPTVLSTIKICVGESKVTSSMHQLEALANGATGANAYARHLDVRVRQYTDPSVDTSTSLGDTNTPDHQQEEAKTLLLKAIGSMPGLRTVRFSFRAYFPGSEWAWEGIIDSLTRMKNLRDLSITLKLEYPYVPQLERLANLQKLAISCDSQTLARCIVPQAASILRKSPSLTSLTISDTNRWWVEPEEAFFLNTLLNNLPKSIPPLALSELFLDHCSLIPTQGVLRHLMNLRSFTCTRAPNEPDDLPGKTEKDKEFTQADILAIEGLRPNAALFWKDFDALPLEHLSLGYVDHATLRYIAAHPRMRTISFSDIDNSRRALVDHLASTFYEDVLPKHVSILENLRIQARYSSLWAFGAHNKSIISQCQNLRTLQLCWDSEESHAQKTLYSIIDLSSTFPHLQQFSISVVLPRGYRGSKCGSSASMFRARCRRKVDDLVQKYGRVKPGKHLHEIKVYKSKFALVKKVKRYSYHRLASEPSDETDDDDD
ncbi:hypothetical protein BDN72DRAFT_876034 [Pluteus cervinus]|uniref:Uncharacterized protein n=1 Tax=Pluteus cervinus TaxID=181527 RepID=A0ACD3B821_9AGAR|nr:hypothetical protein BDN72DRAFT_876034 [Pluteus cervinus]